MNKVVRKGLGLVEDLRIDTVGLVEFQRVPDGIQGIALNFSTVVTISNLDRKHTGLPSPETASHLHSSS